MGEDGYEVEQRGREGPQTQYESDPYNGAEESQAAAHVLERRSQATLLGSP